MPSPAESRAMLLEAIGPTPDLTFIRPHGNIGDELIWAGVRELLGGHVYREIGVDALPGARGELAVIGGGGAWSRRFHAYMPEVLAIAELRFERVIVLPSTFEIAEDRVRAALERSNALVFARELDSYRQIRGFCRARLAHDCAFFADLSAYDAPGGGTLNAFRVDEERAAASEQPTDNDDISASAVSLEEWLRTIERHRVVNTNRAHVMIAAARMGKRVNYSSSSYFKVDAIAESSLGEYDVAPLPESRAGGTTGAAERAAQARAGHDAGAARVTVAVLSRDDSEAAAHAIGVTAASECDAKVFVLDRNSGSQMRAELVRLAGAHPGAEFRLADRDGGIADAVRLAADVAGSEYVMFVDGDTRIGPGALDSLATALDSAPAAIAAAPAVVADDGTVISCGGWPVADTDSISFEPSHAGATAADIAGEPVAATGWVPTLGTLFRRSALDAVPPAGGLDVFCQNADWCLRAEGELPGGLIACPAAVVKAVGAAPRPVGADLAERARSARELPAHARFFERHGRLLDARLSELVPELGALPAGRRVAAAKLLLAQVSAHGPEHTLMEWMNGGLEPLFDLGAAGRAADIDDDRLDWLEARNATLVAIENGGWWRLRDRLLPLRRAVSTVRGDRSEAKVERP